MRLGTLRQGAAVLEDDVAYLLPTSLAHVIELGLDRALEVGEQARHGEPIPFAEADLLLPYKPPSIRDFVTFESHVEGVRRSIDNAVGVPEAWYDAPTFYFTNPHALYGPGQPITRPPTCRALDFEMEVACVVGVDPPLGVGGGGRRRDLRLHDPQRLVGPRHPVPRDAGRARPGQGQGLRDVVRPLDRHRGRAARRSTSTAARTSTTS